MQQKIKTPKWKKSKRASLTTLNHACRYAATLYMGLFALSERRDSFRVGSKRIREATGLSPKLITNGLRFLRAARWIDYKTVDRWHNGRCNRHYLIRPYIREFIIEPIRHVYENISTLRLIVAETALLERSKTAKNDAIRNVSNKAEIDGSFLKRKGSAFTAPTPFAGGSGRSKASDQISKPPTPAKLVHPIHGPAPDWCAHPAIEKGEYGWPIRGFMYEDDGMKLIAEWEAIHGPWNPAAEPTNGQAHV